MNKKGEMGVGSAVMIAIAIIVAIALFSGTFDTVGKMTNIYSVTNDTVTTAATGNGTVTLTGRENTTAITVLNFTGGQDWSENFTVQTTNSAGSLAILLVTTDNAVDAGQNGTSVNISYSYKPDGYNNDAGARGIIAIVLIFGSLAIATVAFPGMREWLQK